MIKFSKVTLIICLLLLIFLLSIGIYFSISKNKLEKEIHKLCLAEDELAGYYPLLPVVSMPVTISVKDKNTNQEKFNFQIENIRETYLTVQPRKCAVYVIRLFNYDSKKTKQDSGYSGYKEEIWKYTYDGNGIPIILLAEEPKEFISYYSPEFQIDPLEHYVTLIKGYLGSSDYAIVIKDLKTLEDMFALSMTEIEKQNPEIVGNINFEDWWSSDGRYFWGRIHEGAYTLGFFRVDTTNWDTEIFVAPEGVGGGDALNIENGLVTRHPGHVWTGIDILTEQIKKEWRKQSKKSTLYLYNLFTKEQILLETTDEPLWFFKPKWLSDNEFEYELPNGEKKIYKLNIQNK